MPIFQSSVVTKHLKTQKKEKIAIQWELFKTHFHNPTIQDNIRNSKEEQYQGEFLIDLFVNVLGYTKNPTPNFNITTEYKNVKDSKKADGAIVVNDIVKAVIELKGTNTTDLGKIEVQAFGYKNNQPECTYVITSNFEKLRFYIDNAIEHIEFNLFTLTEKDFELLYLCLAFENIQNDTPKNIKKESVSQEDAITKKLYNDYSLFKRELHQSLVILNPQFDALTLFQKSQKLLDRFLFLFFAEDRQLLPPNSVRLILNQWKQLKELDAYSPLFDRFKKYFGYLNTGHKGKQYDVYAYNGGLFLPDEVLDNITIDDDLLYLHTLKLSEYDFISEVDVNILGHIFENSLNELDEIKAQLEGQAVDKSKTKRKKDGVFYTPKYITKYIVENTVGKLCEEKKAELEIAEVDYFTDKKRQKKTIKILLNKLTAYRNWLLQITICDPACGSGAFLNQALDFLILEHKYIDELQAKLFGDAMVLSDVEKSILENNLFGVDLNEESVEIAKLSLWLRTAQPNRKLNDLNNNIKCGNSLIDDLAVAGDKAFNWQQEFPQIFKEKNKKAFHITTAVHDSRTSERMIEFKVREKRNLGTNPYPNISYFTEEDEFVITQTIANIVKDDNLNVLAYNICADHIHLLLVCEEEKITRILQKIKSITSKNCTQNRTMEHAPLPYNQTNEQTPLLNQNRTMEHAPLPHTKKKTPLWTQKFGCKEITTEAHLFTAIDYIKHNRSKHHLPQHSKELKLLVESINCSYEHAFRQEYNGGFDVVIGNPPYVDIKALDYELVKKLFKNYHTAENRINLYSIFIEKGYYILKEKGILSFINPNSILVNSSYTLIRKFLINDMTRIVKLPDATFEDATVETIIFEFQKKSNQRNLEAIIYNKGEKINSIDNFRAKTINKENWKLNKDYNFNIYISEEQLKLIIKLEADSTLLGQIADFTLGITPYDKYRGHSQETIKNREYHSLTKIDKNYKPLITGENITRYNVSNLIKEYISYGEWLGASREERFFKDERILVRQIVSGNPPRIYAGFCDEELYFTQIGFGIIPKNLNVKYLIGILNSTLINFYHKYRFLDLEKELFQKILIANCKSLPIKNVPNNYENSIISKVNLIISLNKELQEQSQKFQRAIEREFSLDSLPKKLQDWYLLSYGDFIKELEKKKVKLSLSQKAEWEDYFLQESKKALALKTTIDTTDKEIDQMVYELYGLTKEEIKIVENS